MSRPRLYLSQLLTVLLLLAKLGAGLHALQAHPAFAAPSYKSARGAFANGDIAGASKTLKSLLEPRPKISGVELEEARKLFGVCRFLEGDKNGAEREFSKVIADNPSSKLNPTDVLDPNIEALFLQIKERSRGASPRNKATGSGAASAQARRSSPVKAQVKRITGIEVTTNTKRATIFVNGIFVGTSGQSIALDPGRQQLTVSAEGFEDANKSITLRPGELVKLNVTLRKPVEAPPKTRPTAPEKQRREASAPDGSFGSKKKRAQMDYSGDLPGPKAGASLADEFFKDSQSSVAPPPPRPVAPITRQPVQAPAPVPRATQPRPTSPQPVYQQPQPVYQQPQPVYQQPQPVYQQPQPVYQQPQPVYQQPQPVYQQPQPVYQQPQPVYQQPQPVYQQPTYPSPQPSYQAPTPPPKKVNRYGRSTALALLPFGVGQFQNQDYLKGGLFLTAEAGGIGWALYSWKKEKDFANAEAAALADPTLGSYDPNHSKVYKNGQRMNQYIGWGIFGISWVVGIIDAIANIDTPPPKRSSSLALEEPETSLPGSEFRWSAYASPSEEFGLQLQIRF